MTAIEYLDRPAPGWFALDVMRKEARKWNWVALLVDVHPDDLKGCVCDFPALFYVNPKDYRPGDRTARHFIRSPRRRARSVGRNANCTVKQTIPALARRRGD
jgi:hypothetical protein